MRIGIFGDVHYSHKVFYEMLVRAVEKYNITAAIQVGDFNFSKDVFSSHEKENLPLPLYTIDGNHEDYKFLHKSLAKGAQHVWKHQNLHYQERGSTIVLEDVRVGFIGGAMNVHRPQRMKSGNIITDDNVKRTLQTFNDNPPDIIVSHSCPTGIGVGMQGNPAHRMGIYYNIIMAGFDPGPFEDCGETQLTSLWNGLAQKPRLWVFGHFHRFHRRRVGDTEFISLPCIDDTRQFLLWDTDIENTSDAIRVLTVNDGE